MSSDQGKHCKHFASLTEVAYVSQLASGRPLALQACANMLWALGVLGSANNATVMRIVQFMSQKDCGDLLSTQYHQLFQVQQICFVVNVCNTCIQSHSAVQYHLSIYWCLCPFSATLSRPVTQACHQPFLFHFLFLALEIHSRDHAVQDKVQCSSKFACLHTAGMYSATAWQHAVLLCQVGHP